MSEDLRFPVGKFEKIDVTAELRSQFIKTIEELPKKLRNAVEGLSEEQLETQYRLEGWTVKQVVHHIADSHSNSLIRFKLALTEDVPPIKPYMEDKWAELADSKHAPINLSLSLIDGLHARWVLVLQAMSAQDFDRNLFHPEHGEVSLNYMLSLYDWHCRHHLAHITSLRERNNW
ncbi:MAG: YfiT family bacillithiol transferase [Acidobacteriota bacterium]